LKLDIERRFAFSMGRKAAVRKQRAGLGAERQNEIVIWGRLALIL